MLHAEYLFLSLNTQNPWQFPEELQLCKPNRAWLMFWIIQIVPVCMDNISLWAKLASTVKTLRSEWDPSWVQLPCLGCPFCQLEPCAQRALKGQGRAVSIHCLQFTCRNQGWPSFAVLLLSATSCPAWSCLVASANNGNAGQPSTHIFTTSVILGEFQAWQSLLVFDIAIQNPLKLL